MPTIKDSYIDKYGYDSMFTMIDASRQNASIFVTTNEEVLKDRDILEKHFKFRIRTPVEMLGVKK